MQEANSGLQIQSVMCCDIKFRGELQKFCRFADSAKLSALNVSKEQGEHITSQAHALH
jgi:hypothetical protein